MVWSESEKKAQEQAAQIRKEICKAVRKLGAKCRDEGWFMKVNGFDVPMDVDAERDTSYKRALTGRYRASVGGYGDKRQFPPRKNTPHGVAVEAVAKEMIERAERLATRKAIEENRAAREAEVKEKVKALREVVGEQYFVDIKPVLKGTVGSLDFKPVTEFSIKMNYSIECDFDDAKTLLTLLRDLRGKRHDE